MSRPPIGPISTRKNIAALSRPMPNATGASAKYRRRSMKPPMPKRIWTALGLAVIGLPAIIYGGVFYFIVVAILLAGSAWEYVRLYRAVQFEPRQLVTMGSVLAIVTARFFFPDLAIALFVLALLLAMAVHLVAFERGRNPAATDFAITVTGLAYLGWV